VTKQAELEQKDKQQEDAASVGEPVSKDKKTDKVDQEQLKRRIERVKKAFRSRWLTDQINSTEK